ncbi:MAG TPA: hypothetical protein VMS21_09050, partial [Methylomirabilota bacterium]|nr:hypothetical protein [Methylomirabilota bacterium]
MLLRRPQPRQSESPVRRRRVVGTLCVLLVLGVAGWTAHGQWGEDRRSRGMGQFPRWELDKEMPRDVFTFARVIYNSP